MKYLKYLPVLLICLAKLSYGQHIERVNSGDIIKKCASLYDSANYKGSLSLLKKISRSDTNYVWSLYERAIACEADSQYSNAINYCKEALSLKEQRDYEPDIYVTYGNTLDNMGKPEEAIKVFDAGIAKYPANWLLYFNKGVAYTALNKPAEAEGLYKKTLLINPYMYSAHYQLGVAALSQGKITPAFLCFVGYLLMAPEGKYWANCIKLLDKISKSTDDILAFKNKRAAGPEEAFQEIEEILLSKIALDKAYKPVIPLDDAISRQIQAVFEKMEYNPASADFWVQYYVPYFKKVYTGGKFEPFINHIFSNAKVAVIQDYNKKNKKELDLLIDSAAAYFNNIRFTRELNYNKRGAITERYLFDGGRLYGKGATANNGKILTGRFEGMYAAGNVKSRGNYSMTGQREGLWEFYFYSGKLQAKEIYKNGKLEGPQEYYFENGNLSSLENYANGQASGLVTFYNFAGNVISTANYKLDKKDGEERKYYANGLLKAVNNYVGGSLNGIAKEYYKSGHIKEIQPYANGKSEGPYKSFHDNGKPMTEGQYAKDNAEGDFKYYFENGAIKEKHTYLANNEEGVHEEYDDEGHILVKYLLKKGKINGESVYYYKDGKALAKYTYNNGAITAATYFDKAGRQLSSSALSNNKISIISYNTDGFKKAHFGYDEKGNLDGADTLFYPSGKIRQLNLYKNDELNGTSVSYYLNGNKKSEVTMKDGKEDGYFTGFYVNGQIESEGWMDNGENQGEWLYYDELGRLSNRSYYLNGDLDGYKEDYFANGQKFTEQKYHRGWLQEMKQFDEQGKAVLVDSFPKASGKYKLIFPGGQTMVEADYIHGDFNGPYKTYYFDGSLEKQLFYNKGMLDSTYVGYYYGGVKSSEGRYSFGSKTGTWKVYDEAGKLSLTTAYLDDEMNGEKINYFENGNKDGLSTYKNDLLEGPVKKFAPEGQLAYQVNFENDMAKSYTYLGPDGKMVPDIAIPVNNGPVKAMFPNGKPSRDCMYSDGIKNGADIVYYANGQVRSIDTAAYGIAEGASKEYYPDGKLLSEYHYKADNSTGICREYYKNGALKKEMAFDNGVNHGPVKYYDENGKLVKTFTYFYGTLIAVKNEK